MRKRIKDIIMSLLLVGVAVVCIVRWQAWFGTPEEPFWADENADYVFPSLADADCGTSDSSVYADHCLTILVLGDIHNNLSAADYDTLAARVPDADAVAQIGDWLHRGQNYYYQTLLREWNAGALQGTPVLVCPGNHEYTKGFNKTLSPVWEHAFPHPQNGPVGVPGASYYVDLPQVRFILIDTTPLARMVHFTRTVTWLRDKMNEAGERYVVVMMHHPVFPAGKGRFNPGVFAFFHHVLEDADLVIAGHDHSYMRRGPFVVLNTAGRRKEQRRLPHAEATDTTAVYSVLTFPDYPVPAAGGDSLPVLRTYRLQDGVMIDSVYVQHH